MMHFYVTFPSSPISLVINPNHGGCRILWNVGKILPCCAVFQGRKSSIQLLQPSWIGTLHFSFTVNSSGAPPEKLRNDRELEWNCVLISLSFFPHGSKKTMEECAAACRKGVEQNVGKSMNWKWHPGNEDVTDIHVCGCFQRTAVWLQSAHGDVRVLWLRNTATAPPPPPTARSSRSSTDASSNSSRRRSNSSAHSSKPACWMPCSCSGIYKRCQLLPAPPVSVVVARA